MSKTNNTVFMYFIKINDVIKMVLNFSPTLFHLVKLSYFENAVREFYTTTSAQLLFKESSNKYRFLEN